MHAQKQHNTAFIEVVLIETCRSLRYNWYSIFGVLKAIRLSCFYHEPKNVRVDRSLVIGSCRDKCWNNDRPLLYVVARLNAVSRDDVWRVDQ